MDAAVAATFVEGVVNPNMHTIGGECPMLIHMAGSGKVVCVNGNMAAPELATPQAFFDRGMDGVATEGILAAGAPAAFGALITALMHFGTLSFAEAVAPALALGRSDSRAMLFSVMRKDRDAGYDYAIDRVSVRSSDWRLIETRLPSYGLELLRYRDGQASKAAAAEEDEVVADFLEELHARFPRRTAPIEKFSEGLSPAETKLLRSLGYLP